MWQVAVGFAAPFVAAMAALTYMKPPEPRGDSSAPTPAPTPAVYKIPTIPPVALTSKQPHQRPVAPTVTPTVAPTVTATPAPDAPSTTVPAVIADLFARQSDEDKKYAICTIFAETRSECDKQMQAVAGIIVARTLLGSKADPGFGNSLKDTCLKGSGQQFEPWKNNNGPFALGVYEHVFHGKPLPKGATKRDVAAMQRAKQALEAVQAGEVKLGYLFFSHQNDGWLSTQRLGKTIPNTGLRGAMYLWLTTAGKLEGKLASKLSPPQPQNGNKAAPSNVASIINKSARGVR